MPDSEDFLPLLTSSAASKELYLKVIQETADAIVESIHDSSAFSGIAPEDLAQKVSSVPLLPKEGLGFEAVLENIKKLILPDLLRTSSTSYMAHLHGPSLIESIASELIISTFNQSMDSWDQSPAATELECAVIKQLNVLFGYDKDLSDGCFTSGGTQSNLTAVLLARDWFYGKRMYYDIKQWGGGSFISKLRIYTSSKSHFSVQKACHLLGLGYDAVVSVPANYADMRMFEDALEEFIQNDLKDGLLPFCIVATIGTTDYGSIDNVANLKVIADKYQMWLHADAAYGSGLIMSEKYSGRMGDLSLCDSITVDFHKMFLLPISCSAVLVKNKEDLEPLSFHADYLNREEDEEDGYTNLVGKSLQTTRRFDALKVWTAFQCRGKAGYSKIIDTCIENAYYLFEKLRDDDRFLVLIVPELTSVVFKYYLGGGDIEYIRGNDLNKYIRRSLMNTEGIIIGQTVHKWHVYLKFTLLNPLITHETIDNIIEKMAKLAETFLEERNKPCSFDIE